MAHELSVKGIIISNFFDMDFGEGLFVSEK